MLFVLLAGCSSCSDTVTQLTGGDVELAALESKVFTAPPTTLAAAVTDAAPEIPPLREGELVALPSTGSGLGIRGVAPQGEDLDPSQVAVVFDRPMVALDAITATSANVPIVCDPPIQGRMRWAGTSTAVIVPEGNRFPFATEYACRVPKGTAATDGTALEDDVAWQFSTLRPALSRHKPSEGEEEWDPKTPILLAFNQPVDPATLSGSVHLVGDGTNVPLRFARGSGKQDRPDVVLATGTLKPNTAYTLTLDAGLRGAGGPLGTTAAQEVHFRTYPPLSVEETAPQGTGVSPVDALSIRFSTDVDAAEVNKRITISPTPPDGWKPADTYTSHEWSYWPRLDPNTTYTVTLAPGVVDTHGQSLGGQTWSFTTGDLPAMLDAPEGFQVYPAKNPLTLPVRHRNVSEVDLIVQGFDPMGFVRNPQLWDDYRTGWRSERSGTPVRLPGNKSRNKVAVSTFDLSPYLTDGYGMVRVWSRAPEVVDWQDEPVENVTLFSVTDLGTTLKVTPDGATTWVTRLSDGKPVSGASVEIWRSGAQLWSGTTDKDGLATAKGDLVPDDWHSWNDPVWVVARLGADIAVSNHELDDGLESWNHGVWSSFDPDGNDLRWGSFTDRGVYRLGETAHVQVTMRDANGTGLGVPKDRGLTWKLSDPLGQELGSGKATADDHGTWTTDVKLPTDGALGDYGLEVARGENDRTYVSISARAYRAPSFRVEVNAPPMALAGGTLTASAQGRYLFGAAMKGAKVSWRVGRTPLELTPKGWETFRFSPLPDFDDWQSHEGYESLSQGKGTLGPTGQLPIVQALPADQLTRAWTYEVEATITDVDRQAISNRTTVDVHVAEAYPGLNISESLAQSGTPINVQVATVNPDGTARGGKSVKLTAVRRTWDVVREKAQDGTWKWVNTKKDEPVASGTVTTAGTAKTWTFTPTQGGYHVVRAELEGSPGVVAETGVYALGGEVSWARSDSRTLDLVPDRTSYKPGQTAKILVKAPKKGMRALVTVEREGVWSQRVVTLESTAQAVEVPITAEMMPNAFVTVLGVEGAPAANTPDAGKPGIWYGLVPISVEAEGQRAVVTLSTDREAYQPGDEVTATLTATLDGKPLADGEVTLWAVDHGVLSLTAYETPDLHGRFYTDHPLSVLTSDNRISVYDRAKYLAKGGETGGGGGETGSELRSRFETTPLWTTLRTDGKGRITHRFTLPDNLTTFRIMAVVTDKRAAFGKAEHEIRVNRPLIARPALPRFFRDGDRVLAGIVLHNNTTASVTANVHAEVKGATLAGADRTVTVGPDGAVEVPFAITDFVGTDTTFTFRAEGGGNKDAVEVSVPVEAQLPQEVVATTGSTTDKATESVKLPTGADSRAGGLTVDVSASALVGMGSALDYLLDYPHGCIEQTGSRTRAALLARALREKVGITTSEAKLDEYVIAGLAKMDTFRTPSGAYAYWSGGEPSGPATAYAIEVFADAKAAGQQVDDEKIERASAYVREFLAGQHVPRWWSPELLRAAQAKAALSLARAGQGDAGFNARLYDDRKKLPLFAQAQLLETMARTTGTDGRVRTLGNDLGSAVHVEASGASLVDRDQDRWTALWAGDDLGTSAFVRALMQSQPDHPMLERLVRHLVAARIQGRWSNTYSTVEALAALRDYAARYESGNVSARVDLAGSKLLEESLGAAGQSHASVPMAGLRPGDLLFSATGGRLYYEARLAYAVPNMPPRDEGFTLTRTYEMLEGSGGDGAVTPGALIRVTLRAVTPVDRYGVALVDWLPAGLEPVDSRFATTARSLAEDTGGGGGWSSDSGLPAEGPHEWTSTWIFNRRELGDDHVSLYADYMPAGIHIQSYVARATTPGDYAHPAATIEQMYAPDVYGRTESGRFVVGSPVAAR